MEEKSMGWYNHNWKVCLRHWGYNHSGHNEDTKSTKVGRQITSTADACGMGLTTVSTTRGTLRAQRWGDKQRAQRMPSALERTTGTSRHRGVPSTINKLP